jgi:fructokinase
MPVLAAVEGGGTTWRVALARDTPSNITEIKVFETGDDAKAQLAQIRAWLDERKFDALGIATFGPIDPKKSSDTYGFITTTPKPGWANVDVVGALSDGSVPVAFDTDVNAPALAEFKWNGRPGETSCAYITVGTGVGVGLVVNGAPVHGLLHPEAGHLCLARMEGDSFPGTDDLFGASVEGLAATPALAARKGCERSELAALKDDDPIWEPAAHALAGLCASLVLVASPERIVLSGGVLNRKILYPMVRKYTQRLLHGYVDHPKITTDAIRDYIVPDGFDGRAGIVGALALAHEALEGSGESSKKKAGMTSVTMDATLLVAVAAIAAGTFALGGLLMRRS